MVEGDTSSSVNDNDTVVERAAMMQTDYGRAFMFVKDLLSTIDRGNQWYGNHHDDGCCLLQMTPVAQDKLVDVTLDLLKERTKMVVQNNNNNNNCYCELKDVQVKIGYHYTDENNLDSIGTHGMTDPNNRHHRRRGANCFGKGIYIGSNPYAFTPYGDCGVIVAMLVGQMPSLENTSQKGWTHGVDTKIGNKTKKGGSKRFQGFVAASDVANPKFEYNDEIVLRRASQVIPLVWYRRSALMVEYDYEDAWDTPIWQWHVALQQIVDDFINKGTKTPVHKYMRVSFEQAMFTNSGGPSMNRASTYPPVEAELVIYREPKSSVSTYSHQLDPRNTGPSGTLHIYNLEREQCHGFPYASSSIGLAYDMPGGTQMSHHVRPGKPYQGVTAVAYLPNNTRGQCLLKRLKYAWKHGLTFTIGQRTTTDGSKNRILWASIPHKEFMSGGAAYNGFPDVNYFFNVNQELDALSVPRAEHL